MSIKAIPTFYRGTEFRSRLEARVAHAFDTYGIKWEYEPEAFNIDGVNYLPDFWLTSAHVWIEVKATYKQSSTDTKAQALAKADDIKVFYFIPMDGMFDENRSSILQARGAVGALSSAVWLNCPGCKVMRPWNIGCEDYVQCCDRWFTQEEWWRGHYRDYRNDYPLGLKLAQYKDGRMITDAK
jgi:hypothetical protein